MGTTTSAEDHVYHKLTGTWYEISRTSSAPNDVVCLNGQLAFADNKTFVSTCYENGEPKSHTAGSIVLMSSHSFALKVQNKTKVLHVLLYQGDNLVIKSDSGDIWVMSRKPSMTFCAHKNIMTHLEKMGVSTSAIKPDHNTLLPCTVLEAVKA